MRMFIAVAAFLCAPLTTLAADMPPRAHVEKLIRDSLHSWENGDVELFKSTVTADVVFAYPGAKTDAAGALAIFETWREKYENTRVYFHRIIVEGDYYAAEYQFATTRKANGKRTIAGTVMTGSVRDGKLAVIKEYLDGRVSRMQEAGDLPLGAEGAEPFPWPAAAVPAVTAVPQFDPPPDSMDGARKVIYKKASDHALPMYIFGTTSRSESAQGRAAMVVFHGSGWQSGTVLQFSDLAKRLASRGMVVALAEYRVRSVYGASPFDAVADAKSAIRWIRSNAADLGVNPRKVAAAGASSGGHIALSAALFSDTFDDPSDDRSASARPDLLILFAPVVDTTASGYSDGVPLFNGRELELSPLQHLKKGLPPTLIFQGTADRSVRPDSVQRFTARCTELGNSCTLRLFAGRDHHFYNSPAYFELRPHLPRPYSIQDYRTLNVAIDRFLRANGFLN